MILFKKNFIDALTIGSQFVSNKVGAVRNVKIKVKSGCLSVVSTDGNNFISKKMEGLLDDADVTFCIEPQPLLSYVKSIDDERFSIDIKQGEASIKHASGEMVLPIESEESFVVKKNEPSTISIQMEAARLLDWLRCCRSFIAKDLLRPSLNGLYLYKDGNEIGCCATDCMCMFHDKYEYSGDEAENFGFVIDQACIKTLSETFSKSDSLTVRVAKNSATFKDDTATVLCTFIEGRYPNFKSVIGNGSGTNDITFNCKEFLDAVDRCALCIGASAYVLIQAHEQQYLSLTGKDLDFNKSVNENINAKTQDDIRIAFKYGKLRSILAELGKDEVCISVTSYDKPAFFRKLPYEGNKIFILMPVQA